MSDNGEALSKRMDESAIDHDELDTPEKRRDYIAKHGFDAYQRAEGTTTLKAWLAEQRACGALDNPTQLPSDREVLIARAKRGRPVTALDRAWGRETQMKPNGDLVHNHGKSRKRGAA